MLLTVVLLTLELVTHWEPGRLWTQFVEPRLDAYAGSVFEEACRQFVARGRHQSLPFQPIEVGSWWNADASEEVDVVAIDGAGGLLVGECKWGTIGNRDLETLQRRGRLVATELSSRAGSTERTTHVLFSAGGIERSDELDARLQDGDVIHIPIEALYQENES